MQYWDDGLCPNDKSELVPVTGPYPGGDLPSNAYFCLVCERWYQVTFPTMIDCEIEEINQSILLQ